MIAVGGSKKPESCLWRECSTLSRISPSGTLEELSRASPVSMCCMFWVLDLMTLLLPFICYLLSVLTRRLVTYLINPFIKTRSMTHRSFSIWSSCLLYWEMSYNMQITLHRINLHMYPLSIAATDTQYLYQTLPQLMVYRIDVSFAFGCGLAIWSVASVSAHVNFLEGTGSGKAEPVTSKDPLHIGSL